MAVEPRRGEITREHVAKMLDAYNKLPPAAKANMNIEAFVRGRIDALGIKERLVNTSGHEDLPDLTDIADLIIADLPSYV